MRDAYGEYGAVPSGLFAGLVGYQLSFRVAQEWSGRLFPVWRGALAFGERTDFDTRLVAAAHALLQLVALLQLPMLWSRAEHVRADARLLLCSEDLLFNVWVMCGFLTADLVRLSHVFARRRASLTSPLYLSATRCWWSPTGTRSALPGCEVCTARPVWLSLGSRVTKSKRQPALC